MSDDMTVFEIGGDGMLVEVDLGEVGGDQGGEAAADGGGDGEGGESE